MTLTIVLGPTAPGSRLTISSNSLKLGDFSVSGSEFSLFQVRLFRIMEGRFLLDEKARSRPVTYI